MRHLVPVLAVLCAAWLAMAQQPEEQEEVVVPQVHLPTGGSWGASWEEVEPPTAPHRTDVPWFQKLVDEAEEGSTLTPPPGVYAGPVVLQKRLTIDGGGKVTIDGGGKGTVFVLNANGATLKGLVFTGSGESHSTDDTCLNVRGHENVVEDNRFEDCLFGIDLKQSNKNRVAHNRLRSKDLPLGQRGDALRLWYSMENVVEANTIADARDMVVWYSNGNLFKDNEARRSRYSLHFMYAQQNVVVGNRFYDNSVGIYVMYTQGVEIRNNVISHAMGATGMGIGFKEASNSTVEGNDIVYCAVGIGSDLSPQEPDTHVYIRNNRVAYNGVGITFVGEKVGTIIEGNVFEGNIDQVAQSGGGSAMANTWRGNYWDDYQGFDRDKDGVGDTAYEVYAFTDRIWMETPNARFFKNAPLMEALDFLERLAPFSAPDLVLRDEQPVFYKPQRRLQ